MIENAIEVLESVLAAAERDMIDYDRFREYLEKHGAVELTVQAPSEYKSVGPVRVQFFRRPDHRVVVRVQCTERGNGSDYLVTAPESDAAVVYLYLGSGESRVVAARDGREMVVRLTKYAVADFHKRTEHFIRTGKRLI